MKYLLDTNICVFLLNHVPAVLEAFAEHRNAGVAVSSITLAELEFGICNSQKKDSNRFNLIRLLSSMEVLAFDSEAAIEYGKIRAQLQTRGQPIGPMDMLIAAHAKAAGLVLVTNNTREFSRVDGLVLEDWTQIHQKEA